MQKLQFASIYLISRLLNDSQTMDVFLDSLFRKIPGYLQNRKWMHDLLSDHFEEWGFPSFLNGLQFMLIKRTEKDPILPGLNYEKSIKKLNFKYEFVKEGSVQVTGRMLTLCALRDINRELQCQEPAEWPFLNPELLNRVIPEFRRLSKEVTN